MDDQGKIGPRFNDGLNMAGSYYGATATLPALHAPLAEDLDVDLCVVGGGCTGLSTALHAAERGLSVVVLEGGRVGFGASGRNGGQLIPGLRKGASELIELYGATQAHALFQAGLDARETVLSLIRRFNIDCDLKLNGHLLAAVKSDHARDFAAEIKALNTLGYFEAEALSPSETMSLVGSAYAGGLLDHQGGHYHPLKYTLGLAAAAERAGARIFEASPVIALDRGKTLCARTATAIVRAKRVMLAGDAYLAGIYPPVEKRYIPIGSYIAVTAPLRSPEAFIRQDLAVSDTRFVVNYFRLTKDGRLLFGGGESYFPRPPRDMAAFVRGPLTQTFPQLRNVKIDYVWGGQVSVTMSRLPHIGRDGDIYFAHGYSGMGALMSTHAGKLIAEAMSGDEGTLDLFQKATPSAFPGGHLLRTPLQALGMLWFALRDRL
ncbi:NAD(P)/FAD-dependent oxidoreductase [Asticcacaulis benevestitus]|uniref:FAD dependent oxidoreductase domain-containing protein n=1 Tax=Asticcacaulis benevestitus DSM 16100 = ATCC BAA-896 TaxID=1121022 RepID=V4P7X1_9CAUL|nr:FAD-binding oxidoreductase [Asticcacaulis benevestitus]ESQ83194.1 hypothetical protein ABENE_20445 [Asticcacaulis benevestitus DSM 16100 = ATCC BAA-896]